jgi:hypothetical protein
MEFGIPVKVDEMCLNETHSKVRIGKHLCDTFPIHTGLKQRNALEYAIRKVQENEVEPKLKRTYQPLVYAPDASVLG